MKKIQPSEYFYCCDGSVFKNVEELARGVKKLSVECFATHVSKDKNDFANWVEGVFGEKKLAKALRKAKTKKETEKVLAQWLKHQRELERLKEYEQILRARKVSSGNSEKKFMLAKIKAMFS
ncbi:hypothetical protein D6817_02395 [Candidatus Pacearchaeota archaeon]|nr:MAG: hypothetical protein D6817_02395 [Candidatus Pacearchaeota archaeon]